jgi:hypothetical protein
MGMGWIRVYSATFSMNLRHTCDAANVHLYFPLTLTVIRGNRRKKTMLLEDGIDELLGLTCRVRTFFFCDRKLPLQFSSKRVDTRYRCILGII